MSKLLGREIPYREYRDGRSSQKYSNSVKIHISDKEVLAYFNDQDFYDWSGDARDDGAYERGALHKQIPMAWIINGTEDYLWGVFSGLLDSDGSVTKNMVTGNPRFGCSISTCSPFLRKTFVELCHRLGVRCGVTVSRHKPRANGNPGSVEYMLRPSTIDIKKNLDKIQCVGERERTLLEEWKKAPLSLDQTDIIPLTNKERKLLRAQLVSSNPKDSSLYSSLGKKTISRESLMRRSELLEESGLETLKARVENTGVLWDKVNTVNILDKREVFDLCVPETKVFAVDNGLIIWDTMTYHVPVSTRAVREAYDKMLPSKNLLSARDYTAHYLPQEEFNLGIYLASRDGRGPVKKVFKTRQEAILAYRRGEIDLNDNIQVLEN